MRTNTFISILIAMLFLPRMGVYSQDMLSTITLNEVIELLSLQSPNAQIAKANFQNEQLQFENYKKGFLPTFSFTLSPINFNRSLRLLQASSDGSYSYVEDYSNSGNAGVSVRQKVRLTGGELSIGSGISYLNEFTRKRNSFNTTPFSISYTQPFWGSGTQYRYEQKIENAKHRASAKQYCTQLCQIQKQALDSYLTTLLQKMEQDLALQTIRNTEKLLQLSHIKLQNDHITEYELKQVKLQSLNAQYTLDNARKHYVATQEQLATLLGVGCFEFTIPEFDIPFSLASNVVMSYINKNNPITNQQQVEALEAEYNLFSVKRSNRFNGNVSLSYGMNQYAENFADAYRNGNSQQSVVVTFQIPVFEWGANKNRLKISQNTYEASRIRREQQIREFGNEAKEYINNYNHSVRLWITSKETYQLSCEQYKQLLQKFYLGEVSVYEVIMTQNTQNDAMQWYYSAIRDTYKSYLSLRSMALYDFKRKIELEGLFL